MTSRIPRIECGAFVLRRWRAEDADGLVRWADNPAVARFLRDRFPSPYRREDAERFLAGSVAGDVELAWAIEVAGEPAGGIGLIPGADIERFSAELGYWLGEPFWGQGIATAAVLAVVAHGFRELDLLRVWAITFVANPASARVLAKAGFSQEGHLRSALVKRGEVHDARLWARVNPDWRMPGAAG